MNAISRALLAEIQAYGCRVLADREHIGIRGPVSKLPPELIERVRASKAELVQLVTIPPATGATPSAAAAEREGIPALPPLGASTSAADWARWFAAHPEKLGAAE